MADEVVRLVHGDAKPPYVSTTVLLVGQQVAYKDSDPVTYDGDDAAFTRAYAELCAPARVKIDMHNMGEKQVVVDGHTVTVPVVQRTLRLLDG